MIADAFAAMGSIPGVARPRSLGMIGALDLHVPSRGNVVRDTLESEADLPTSAYLSDAGWLVYEAARRRGAYLRPLGETIYICPPLNTPDDVLEELLSIVRSSVEEVVDAARS